MTNRIILSLLFSIEKGLYYFDWGRIWFWGWRAIQQGNYDLAIEINKMFLTSFPNNDFAHYMQGKSYMKMGNKELATENFNKFLESDPENM